MSQAHTVEVLEAHGFAVALRFHLEARCYPPAGYWYDTARRAIRNVRAGRPDARVRLPRGVQYDPAPGCPGSRAPLRTTAPSWKVVEVYHLEAFLD